MRVQRLHAKQSRKQKSLQAIASERLENNLANKEQAVCQATHVPQKAKYVVGFAHNDKSLLV